MMKIILATKNNHKVSEIKKILRAKNFELFSLDDIGFSKKMPEETGTSFKENALLKAKFISEKTGEIALADDSGLCIDVLDGRPGIFSARYAGTDSSEDNIKKILHELLGVPYEKRTAYFFASIALVFPNINSLKIKENPLKKKKYIIFDGKTKGHIFSEKHGDNSFGYDPIFEPFEFPGKSFAEISSEQKNRISHRGKALQELANFFFTIS